MLQRNICRSLGALSLSALMAVSSTGTAYADAYAVPVLETETQEIKTKTLEIQGTRITLELSELDLYAAAQRAIDEGRRAELRESCSLDGKESALGNHALLYEMTPFSPDLEDGKTLLAELEEIGGEIRFFVEKEEGCRDGAENHASFAFLRKWFRHTEKQEAVLYETGSRLAELLELFCDHTFSDFTEVKEQNTDESYLISGKERITILFGNTNAEQQLHYLIRQNGKRLGQEITVRSGEKAAASVLRGLREKEWAACASEAEIPEHSSPSGLFEYSSAESEERIAAEAGEQSWGRECSNATAEAPSQEETEVTSMREKEVVTPKVSGEKAAEKDKNTDTSASAREDDVSAAENEAEENTNKEEAGIDEKAAGEEGTREKEGEETEESTSAAADTEHVEAPGEEIEISAASEEKAVSAGQTVMDRELSMARREALEGCTGSELAGEGLRSAVFVQYPLSELQKKRKSELTAKLGGKTFTVRSGQSGFPQDAELVVAELPQGLAAQILTAARADEPLAPLFAYDLKIVANGKKYRLPEGETVEVTLEGQGDTEEELRLVHVHKDLMDDVGRLDTDAMNSVVNAVRKGEVTVDAEQRLLFHNGAAVFSLDGFSTVIGAVPSTGTYLLKANMVTYKGSAVDKVIDLLENKETEIIDFPYNGIMRLEVEAEFGAGKDKTIEVSIPKGLSFRSDYDKIYAVENTDGTLKKKITPAEQILTSKKNEELLGQDMYNGTITLQYHSLGEENDAKRVKFSIPIATSWAVTRNRELWESGIGWFYDELSKAKSNSIPVKITQSINGRIAQEVQLDRLTIQNEESKRYDVNWKAAYEPDIPLGGQMTGSEVFQVLPIPNGVTYTNAVAYRSYSITYTVPEGAEFVGFRDPSNKGKAADFAGAELIVTPGGQQTKNGYIVPVGRIGYTWTIQDKIVSPYELKVSPIWKFSDTTKFRDGDRVRVAVSDVKVRYSGRNYAAGEYEEYDPAKYPSLTYRIAADYEEVFVTVAYDDKNRYTDGYESERNYKLYLGAPGYEHRQERNAGYFRIGNRGTADSAPKTVTISYDWKDTGAIGITEQRIPTGNSEYSISNVQARLWDRGAGTVSGWQNYTGTNNHVNRADFGVSGDSDIYIKELRFDISTIPSQSYLLDGTENRGKHVKVDNYEFYANVLSDQAYEQKKDSEIESKLVIANKQPPAVIPADTKNQGGKGSNSRYVDIAGKANNGLYGKALVIGNNLDYDQNLSFLTGTENNSYSSMLHFHAWSMINAQDVDAIYLISPFGEPYTNIRMHYNTNNKLVVWKKRYADSKYSANPEPLGPQPEIIEMEPGEGLKAKYPKARLYRLDFTKITDAQERYDSCRIGGNVITAKSLENTRLSTNSQYNGVWISFDYAPKLSDPAGTYKDLFWVEYRDDAAVPIVYQNNGHNCPVYPDEFGLRSVGRNPEGEMLGRLHTLTLTPSEGLSAGVAAKRSTETEEWYRTYKEGDPSTIIGMDREVNYKLSTKNESSLPVSTLKMYWPVPKEGEDWGKVLTPSGAFQYSMHLTHAPRNVPEGFRVYYARNAEPTEKYEKWENSCQWIAQSQTAAWSDADWNRVNFVQLEWVGTEEKRTIENGDSFDVVFNLTLDDNSELKKQNQINIWRPYFLRAFQKSASWEKGETVATMLSPGYLGGTVWDDLDFNGVRDPGEPRLSDVLVELYDTSSGTDILRMTTQTDVNGVYRFNGLKDGSAGCAGQTDKCRIVIYNPSDADYMGFTCKRGDMIFDASYDQKIAKSTAIPSAEERKANRYHAGLIRGIPVEAPSPEKVLFGDQGDQLNGITFRFRIEGENGTEPLPVYEGEENTEAVRSISEIRRAFGTVFYRRAGCYSYRIMEIPGSASELPENFSYDQTVYRWTVELRKDEASGAWNYTTALHVERSEETTGQGGSPQLSGAVFRNAFHFDKLRVALPRIRKQIWGDETSRPRRFRFTVHPLRNFALQGEELPKYLHEETPIEILGEGETSPGELEFSKPGNFEYRVSEVNGGIQGYRYDTTQYFLRYTVWSEGNRLVSILRIFQDDKELFDTDILNFVNEYERPPREDNGDANTPPLPRRGIFRGIGHIGDSPKGVLGVTCELVEPLAQGVFSVSRKIRTADGSRMAWMGILFFATAFGFFGWIAIIRKRKKK